MRPAPIRLQPLALLLAMASPACAADAYPVTALPGPLQVAIQYKGLPISLGLSHLEVPAEAQAAFQERLGRLVIGKRVEEVYTPDFGLDASGAARVQLVLGTTNVNEALIAAGLARYQDQSRWRDALNNALMELWENGRWQVIADAWFGPGSKYESTLGFAITPIPR